jgi:hypothetical protein
MNMKSKLIGAESDADREFDARYRDASGKLLWRKLGDDILASGVKPRCFIEVQREMMELVRKREEEELKMKRAKEDTSGNAV